MAVMRLKACPRCHGDLTLDEAYPGDYAWVCLACARHFSLVRRRSAGAGEQGWPVAGFPKSAVAA